jgi:hypothetical protein
MEWIIVGLILVVLMPLLTATPLGEYLGLGMAFVGILIIAFGLSLAGVLVIFALTGFPGTR